MSKTKTRPRDQTFALAATAIALMMLLRVAMWMSHRMLWKPGSENMPATMVALLWLLLATLLGGFDTVRATLAASDPSAPLPSLTKLTLAVAWLLCLLCVLVWLHIFTRADALEWTVKLL